MSLYKHSGANIQKLDLEVLLYFQVKYLLNPFPKLLSVSFLCLRKFPAYI